MLSKVEIKPTLDVRGAVQAATGYFNLVFPSRSLRDTYRVDVEEIEMSKDNRYWLVTLGYDAPARKNPQLPDFLQVPTRKYKVFKVDARTGAVVAMKMPEAA
jgi:hypothetical protein